MKGGEKEGQGTPEEGKRNSTEKLEGSKEVDVRGLLDGLRGKALKEGAVNQNGNRDFQGKKQT